MGKGLAFLIMLLLLGNGASAQSLSGSKIKKEYSYTKSWLEYLKVKDYVIVYNGLLISDSVEIKCVFDKLDFTDHKYDLFFDTSQAYKRFGIKRSVWYIQSKRYTILDFRPILKCLCNSN